MYTFTHACRPATRVRRGSRVSPAFLLLLWLTGLCCGNTRLAAQTASPEFPKGYVGYLSLQQGLVSDFTSSADVYQVGFSFAPQYTVVPRVLRLGLLGTAIYTQHRWQAQVGPQAALRLFDIKAGTFGTLVNVQLTAAHLWGSRNQKLAGGGIQAEIFQLFTIAFSGYRDYGNNQWWLQSSIGYNILKPKKRPSDPFQ